MNVHFASLIGRAREHDDMTGVVAPWMRQAVAVAPQLALYTLVSGACLACDLALYLSLTAMAIAAALAGAIGYAAGLVLHYALSVRFVFDAAATAKASAQLFGEFALSGLVGLGITTLVIWLATDVAGASALVAKIPAAAASFMGVFALRRMVVFARG